MKSLIYIHVQQQCTDTDLNLKNTCCYKNLGVRALEAEAQDEVLARVRPLGRDAEEIIIMADVSVLAEVSVVSHLLLLARPMMMMMMDFGLSLTPGNNSLSALIVNEDERKKSSEQES